MIQSLNISRSALRTMQQAIDNTSNNMANIDTYGYKRKSVTFSELLSDRMKEQPYTDAQRRTTAEGLRIGSGVKLGHTKLDMAQGSAKITEIPSDLMIEGDGFFMVSHRILDNNGILQKEEYRLTRDGAFRLTNSEADPEAFYNLVTASGDVLVDDRGIAIEIPKDQKFKIEPDGSISLDGDRDSGLRIPLWEVPNADKFVQAGNNEFLLELPEGETNPGNVFSVLNDPNRPEYNFNKTPPTIRQGALEMSNVSLQDEMSQLVVIQRAFQLNSRAVGIADQMMGIANSIRSS
ncbi:flagellar hook-basal body protein [Brevibacillus sp. SYSU BS000544]|uniref:flagellar hook-basal body protein n=1 Tax=Brevibacillus sp. SYSU BS000544 TaxID=3416443 RepID=UPI003CE4FDEE